MKIKTFFFWLTFSLCCMSFWTEGKAQQQSQNRWRTLLSYYRTVAIADTDTRVFGVSEGGGLYSVSKSDSEDIRYYDRTTGLSESDIHRIGYDKASQTLVIYYRSGNIDLLTPSGVSNLPAIRDNTRLMNKTLARMCFGNGRIYLAGGFGIMVIDPDKMVVLGTYQQGKNVIDLALIGENKLWAFCEGKLIEGVETDNLQDPYYWKEINLPLKSKEQVLGLAVAAGNPILHLEGGRLVRYILETNKADTIVSPLLPEKQYIHSIASSPHGYIAKGEGQAYIFRQDKEDYKILQTEWAEDFGWYSSAEQIWLAMGMDGIAKIRPTEETPKVERLGINMSNTPSDDKYFYSTFSQGRYFSVSGGRGSYRFGIPFSLKIYDGHKWTNFSQKEVEEVSDATSVAVDPKNPGHYFVSTHGEGLIEFKDNQYYKTHDGSNSPIRSAKNLGAGYYRVGSLCYDRYGNLWMTQNEVAEQVVLMLDADGNWQTPQYTQIRPDNAHGHMVAVGGDIHWLAIYHENTGVYVFDASPKLGGKGGEAVYYSTLSDRNGKAIPASSFHCMTLDRGGVLWLGSDAGICSIHSPSGAIKRPPVASRPIAGEEPNLYYVLDNVSVRAIVVDRLNHKWIGTLGNGLFLMNEDCTEILRQYKTTNSPILSDNIATLSLDENNGILYIGTDKGLMSLSTGGETASDEVLEKIYAWPNPLRPEQPDMIIIEGLKAGCNVKIINTQGRLLFEENTIDDRLLWNARNADGSRVDSGIYHILVYDPETKAKTKLSVAVIK
ncbi:hypothetical protein HQ45_08150 [Porphyromonas crevioricanis]|uniref:type IX secretion system anionic LPS delivery protein PorZ n=1 Tax=Porphyromonas crevioricanis TaxID=393921 RepID=UPI00052B97E0|nr:hypothetical protein [Porphyromonas crevioricanis]KGN88672.1 hypothetical protein HQ45_08150 [Porphyromonas crevioricanis]